MSEVRKGTSRNSENENKRRKIFNNVLNMNVVKKNKRKIKKNKQKGNKKKKKINKKKLKNFVHNSLVLYLAKKWLNP